MPAATTLRLTQSLSLTLVTYQLSIADKTIMQTLHEALHMQLKSTISLIKIKSLLAQFFLIYL